MGAVCSGADDTVVLPCVHLYFLFPARRKAVKATLVLLPLLGITYMLFFVNPGEDDISQIVFIYFNSFLQSFQVREQVYRWYQLLLEGSSVLSSHETYGKEIHGRNIS